MGLVSKDILEGYSLEEFSPGKVLEQLQDYPGVFQFLKSKEDLMGRARPLVTFMAALSIWVFKKVSPIRRNLPPNLLDTLWKRIYSNRELAQKVEELESDLWDYFLSLLQGARQREEISDREIGVGALVYSTILLGLLFVFWPEEKLYLVEELIRTTGENTD